jgi:hypothetical protein
MTVLEYMVVIRAAAAGNAHDREAERARLTHFSPHVRLVGRLVFPSSQHLCPFLVR